MSAAPPVAAAPAESPSPAAAPATERLPLVDALRGLAALAVCWYHVTLGRPGFLPAGGWLAATGRYGWSGVDVFFVVSGFVLPLAMHRAGYRLADAPRFLAKRALRIDPPYLASAALAAVAAWLSARLPGYRGEPFHASAAQVLCHVGYLCDLLHGRWLNPVYWTLALELQFYVLLALCAPLLLSRRPSLRLAAIGALAGLALLLRGHDAIVGSYLFLFLLGVVVAEERLGHWTRGEALALLALCAAGSLATRDLPSTVAALATALVLLVAAGAKAPAPLVAVGEISYSLYLVHVPVGGRVINLVARATASPPVRALAPFGAVAASLVAAAALWALVERPARRWASRVRYRAATSRGSGTP